MSQVECFPGFSALDRHQRRFPQPLRKKSGDICWYHAASRHGDSVARGGRMGGSHDFPERFRGHGAP